MINIDLQVKTSILDDFYLQWEDIYWWQMRFNLELMIINTMNELVDDFNDILRRRIMQLELEVMDLKKGLNDD